MSAFFTIAIFFAVIALAAVLFFGWVVVVVARLIIGGVGMLLGNSGGPSAGGAGRRLNGAAGHTVRCQTRGCHAINPASARFCRRCGRGLPAAHQVQVRRAAVW